MLRGQPLDERTAGVQRQGQVREAIERVEERPVAVLKRLLDDVVEVADRLVLWSARTNRMGVVMVLCQLLDASCQSIELWSRRFACRRSGVPQS